MSSLSVSSCLPLCFLMSSLTNIPPQPASTHSNGIEAVLNARVAAVERFSVKVVDAQTELVTDIPFGACVWATGVAMNPLVRELQQKLPEQANFRSLVTDNLLQVKGSNGTIFALGMQWAWWWCVGVCVLGCELVCVLVCVMACVVVSCICICLP